MPDEADHDPFSTTEAAAEYCSKIRKSILSNTTTMSQKYLVFVILTATAPPPFINKFMSFCHNY